MQEDMPEEVEAAKMWLDEKVTSLEKEKEEMMAMIQQMEERLALHKRASWRHLIGVVFWRLRSPRSHNTSNGPYLFNKSTNSSISALVGEVKAHQSQFQEMAKILQSHEQHIANGGAASQEMAQYINALVQEIEKKSLWIAP